MNKNLPNLSFSYFSKASILASLLLFFINTINAQTWDILGNEGQISSVAANYTSIAVIGEVPYVVYKEGTAGAIVKKRNSTTGVWEQFGNIIGANVTYSRIYADRSENLYISYVDEANGNKLAVRKYWNSSSTWEPLDSNSINLYVSTGSVNGMSSVSQYNSSVRASMAFDSDNNPYIAFSEGGTSLTPYVKKFDGTSWVTVNSNSVNPNLKAVAISLIIDEVDIPWIAFCSLTSATSTTGNMELYRGSAGTWTSATASAITGIRHTSLALNSVGNLTVAYFNIASSNKAATVTYNKTAATWSSVTNLGTRDCPNISLIRDINGSLYCSFIDYQLSSPNYTYTARVFKQMAGATTWSEMKDPTVTRGIDEPVGNVAIAIGSNLEKPYVVYTKNNSGGISTPIVRAYSPPPPPAVLTTTEPSNIQIGSATVGGNITSDGGSAITQRGVVYGTSANPTIAGNKVTDALGGKGAYSLSVSGLSASTYYYLRAYATNANGTTYGNTVHIYTPSATSDAVVTTPKQMEYLTRGVVAVRKTTGQVYISWRLLGTDPADIAFNIYRDGTKLNSSPITTSTNYTDNISTNGNYTVRPVIGGVEGTASSPVSVWSTNQLVIPLQIPAGGVTPDNKAYTYSANDASVGDVDGDGEYEVILKWDPSVVNDNAGGYSGKQFFDCYRMNGTRLWRIDLGINVNAGPHYNQFMVYDFDGDGKSEIILKTADGTTDGVGTVIGNSTVDYRNTAGWVQQGPEFLTVFNGLTGAAMSTINYQPARGNVSDWGDNYGNRQDRFVSAVAYIDGARPSLIVGRGYYNKLVRAAYDWRNGNLSLRWIFDSKDASNPVLDSYSSMGNHQMTIGDIDGDGKDEIINGSSAINDNGKGLWTTGKGHGDALHMTDLDPSLPGQEIWINLESESQYTPYGLRQYNAKTGATNWGIATTGDVGRSMAADIDPTRPGYEMWSSSGNLYDVKGNQISTNKPTYNFGIWWDGDLARELLDGTKLDKWNYTTNTLGRLFTIYQAAPISSNNSTKANPCLQADIFGDWREEMIFRYADNTALVIFTTNISTDKRIQTLMHDPQYRTGIAWQNSAYNQPPYPSFYLGYDMPTPPVPNIYLAANPLPIKLIEFKAKAEGNNVALNWATASEVNNKNFSIERSLDGKNFTSILSVNGAGTSNGTLKYAAIDYTPVAGINYYRLRQIDFDGNSSLSQVEIVNILKKENSLTISPNPADSKVELDFPSNDSNLTLVLYSIDGKVLLQATGNLQNINDRLNSILPGLASGIYPVSVKDSYKVYTQKLVKR